jgi:hypothetical protein
VNFEVGQIVTVEQMVGAWGSICVDKVCISDFFTGEILGFFF